MLPPELPVAPLPATICVEVVRACGLLAAVDEAALWLGGGEAKASAACMHCSSWLDSTQNHSPWCDVAAVRLDSKLPASVTCPSQGCR